MRQRNTPEAPPVGKDEQRQLLAHVKVPDCLSRLMAIDMSVHKYGKKTITAKQQMVRRATFTLYALSGYQTLTSGVLSIRHHVRINFDKEERITRFINDQPKHRNKEAFKSVALFFT
jgi:polyphosphate kinase